MLIYGRGRRSVVRCGKRKRDTAAILFGIATPRENVQFLKNPHHEGMALDVWNSGVVCDKYRIGL
jgi:hypothetical protein